MSDYLLRNSYGIYHSRMAVPKRLRSALEQREVKRSLNAKSHAKAARLARSYTTFLELLFEKKIYKIQNVHHATGFR